MQSSAQPEIKDGKTLFWRIWEKFWWLAAILFLCGNAWIIHNQGWITVIRVWAVVFSCLGAFVILYAMNARRIAIESIGWLPVEATIISSEVIEEVQKSSSNEASNPISSMIYYYPEVLYEYEVEGRTCRSNRILTVKVNFPRSEAYAVVNRYQPGMRTRAWCNPRRHQQAVLEPGLAGWESKYRKPFIVGAGFLAFGIGTLIFLKLTGF
jgi:hypothetical protein